MAKLKGRVKKDDYDKLTPELQGFYELDGDWAYLKEGETEDVEGLKSALEKEKRMATERQQRLEAFKDIDPAKYKEAVDSLKRIEEMEKDIAIKIDSATKQVTEKYEKQIKDREKTITFLSSQLEVALVDSSLLSAMGDKVISPKVLLPHAKQRVKMIADEKKKTFVVNVVDTDGNVRISQKSKDNSPMTMQELIEEMGNEDDFKPLFKASTAAGSGASGGNQPPPGSGAAVVLPHADALDPAKYRAAKDRAAKEGVPFQIEPAPTGR